MQTRPYPGKDGSRVWLSRREATLLLQETEEDPRRRIALQLGLHGLRTDEILEVRSEHIRALESGVDVSSYVLEIPRGKTGKRETPLSGDLADRIIMLKNAAQIRKDEPVIDVSTRTVRNWIRAAREDLEDREGSEEWSLLGMHDLRRTWATDSFYSLAFSGIPIAEQLVMSWGGWSQTESGRETWRENYLGPVPDHIALQAIEQLPNF